MKKKYYNEEKRAKYIQQLNIYEKEVTDEHWKYNNPFVIMKWMEDNLDSKWDDYIELEDRTMALINEYAGA